MSNYNRNNRSGGGRFGGGDFRKRDSGRRQMHKAVCDECGKDCEVPFKPSGDKPIYCSSCFEKKEGGSPRRPTRRGSGGSDFGKRDNTNKQLLEQVGALNTKLDRILKVLEPSTEKKSVVEKPKVKKTVKKAKAEKASEKKTKKASKKDK
jgi:CxxC-x17-CxxC domain-containing protein